MELWIRSQDKEKLRKIVDLKYQKGSFDDDSVEVIVGTSQYDEWEVLGIYKTKERALEVLDEIQEIINPIPKFICTQHIDFDRKEEGFIGYTTYKEEPKIEQISDVFVYEMPKE